MISVGLSKLNLPPARFLSGAGRQSALPAGYLVTEGQGEIARYCSSKGMDNFMELGGQRGKYTATIISNGTLTKLVLLK